ncbi:MAG TPA: DegT/DnrJ/EryC1/StrS family aminotransferase [Thermoleophilaceae bacterium]|nr:DegT/DnrJ/EryC1/StrS family aminotransferase [Thermoleophilaceae bacterium]
MSGSRIPFVDLAPQHESLAQELRQAFERTLSAGDFILGEEVELFEHEFAEFCGVRYAVGVDSGTTAIELALRAVDCGPGDEVITVPNTFIATALAITLTGARPVFVDVDPVSRNMDPQLLAEAITPRTKAVVPVHLYGQPADMEPICDVARAYGVRVVEDAAQAHGARYRGRPAGSLADAAAFSFYPSKNLGAVGDAGAVTTDDEDLAERLRLMRNYGQRTKNRHDAIGFNRRLDTLQAAFLRVKLPRLRGWIDARRERARRYGELLADTAVEPPVEAEGREHVWHLYVIRAAGRDELRASLTERGIDTGLHYPVPIHLQPAYAHLGYGPGSFPIAERLAEESLSLPMYPELPEKWLEEVARSVVAHERVAPDQAA